MTVTMDSNAMDAILSEAGMRLEDDKATKEMQRSISKFASLLICPLCNKVRMVLYKCSRIYRKGGVPISERSIV